MRSYNVSVFAVADVGSGQSTYASVTTIASTAATDAKSSTNTGAILGGVIGGFVALILIIVVVRTVMCARILVLVQCTLCSLLLRTRYGD